VWNAEQGDAEEKMQDKEVDVREAGEGLDDGSFPPAPDGKLGVEVRFNERLENGHPLLLDVVVHAQRDDAWVRRQALDELAKICRRRYPKGVEEKRRGQEKASKPQASTRATEATHIWNRAFVPELTN
jgi:hypothetical protein